MSQRRCSFVAHRIALGLVLAYGTLALTQQPPAVAPNPQAPTLNMPTPMGMQRGVPLDLVLTGTNLAEPTGFWSNIPGLKAVIPTDANNGKDNAKLLVKLEVPKETPLGFYAMRLATTRGISNIRLFCIDDLPQVMEVDTNRAKTTPQVVAIPSVVVGRVDAETSDYFKITAKAGQKLGIEVLGHRLGSALDPQITIYEAASQREVSGGHSNDAPGLQTDARLIYTFKDAGDYLIEIRDVQFRGGPDFYYRMRIGEFPCATTPIPMAAKRGSKVAVNFAGPAVEGVSPVEVTVPADPNLEVLWVAPKGANGQLGWPVALTVSDLDEVVEQEPNNEPGKATRVPAPGAVTGRFLEKGDIDHFVFTAKKGQRFFIDAQTHELNSPTEVYMVLKNAMGGEVGKSNPAAAPRIDFTAPADGDFTISVEHLLYWFGPSETYRIAITPYEPGFDLSLLIDRYDVPQGSNAAVNVMATRRDYAGPIEVSVVGHPGITGQATIAAGQPTAPNLPATLLFLSAKPDAPLTPFPVKIQGKATINGKVVVRDASVKTVLSTNLGALLYPPANLVTQPMISVSEKPPFTLVAKFDTPESLRGPATNVTITATRAAGFAEEIALAPLGLPPNVAAALKPIPKGQNEFKGQLTPAANAPIGSFTISFTGKAKHQNKDYTVTAAPVPLVLALPFDLQVQPAPLKIAPGGKGKITVTAVRKAGYQGPITLEVRNLPANVTATKPMIAMGQSAVEVEITAAANAALGDKADVNVLGTAPAAANQQNASANFTVSIAK